jgi:hypothetical protein
MIKPSELIRLHISGAGNGFELDDLMSAWTGGIYDEISERIVQIHHGFKNKQYKIGTSNPDSYEELERLASELEQRGY